MNKNLANVFWGIVLIAFGAFALAQTMGYKAPQHPVLWASIFAGLSLISLIFYLISGWRNWGGLFPVGIFGALALLLGMVANGADNPAMAAPLFIGIGLPFVLAYFLDRSQNWWALIPAGIMAFLTLVLFAVDNVPGEVIGAGLFFILAVVFFLVYLSRRATWAVIVAYVMFILGFMPLMATTSRPELSGIVFLFAIGLPFLYVYFTSPERWWAIIPAGSLLTLGIVTAVILLPGIPEADYDTRIANIITYTGFAATFAVVWFRNHKRWAMFLTIISAIVALAGLFLRNVDNYWPLIIVAIGVYMLYNAMRPRTT